MKKNKPTASDQMSTKEVADLLNVSRSFVVKLMDAKKIPSTLVGTKRRVSRKQAMAYKAKMEKNRNEALDEIARINKESGLEY
jgi:excisionase family DNA binding protein